MSDDRYLDGDPRADEGRFLYTDLAPFVQTTHQELRCIYELIRRKRYDEAESLALGETIRAKMVLDKLEKETLPAVDLDRTADAAIPEKHRRTYKDRG